MEDRQAKQGEQKTVAGVNIEEASRVRNADLYICERQRIPSHGM